MAFMPAVSQPFRLTQARPRSPQCARCFSAWPNLRARLAMSFWGLPDDAAAAPREAFKTYRHGAAQPVSGVPSDHVVDCVGIRVVSFNFGIPQSMLQSDRQWNSRHNTFHTGCNQLGIFTKNEK